MLASQIVYITQMSERLEVKQGVRQGWSMLLHVVFDILVDMVVREVFNFDITAFQEAV